MRPLALALLALLLVAAPASARPGDLDGRFGDRGRAVLAVGETSSHARAIALQPDGKLIVAGTSTRGTWMVSRLTASGRLDRSFGERGHVRVGKGHGEPFDVVVRPDGKILVGGTPIANGHADRWMVARLLPDGRLDRGWAEGGTAELKTPARAFFGGMAVQPDGGIAVTAAVHDRDHFLVVMRMHPDGRRDEGFGDGGAYTDPEYGAGTSIVARPDGRLLVGGQTGSIYGGNGYVYGGHGKELVLALTADGRVDTTWGREGRFVGPTGSRIYSLQLAPDGSAVALDALRASGSALLWLTPEGRKRDEWALEGRASAGGVWGTEHALDEHGRIYVAGYDGRERAAVSRLSVHGTQDRSFGTGGIARIPDRKPIVRSVGESIALGPGERVYLAASGADMEQGDREDYGYTHALIARFKGWEQLVRMYRVTAKAGSRRLKVGANCRSARPCRLRVDVRDRRGRLIGRTVRRRFSTYYARNVRVKLRRPARRGERLTIRLRATNAAGQADSLRRGITV